MTTKKTRNLLNDLIKSAKLQQEYESAIDAIGFDAQIDTKGKTLAKFALFHEEKVLKIKNEILSELEE